MKERWKAEEYGTTCADGTKLWAVYAEDHHSDARPGDLEEIARDLTKERALLMAGAPGLLIAAKIGEQVLLDMRGNYGDWDSTDQGRLDAVQAAIAKATGG